MIRPVLFAAFFAASLTLGAGGSALAQDAPAPAAPEPVMPVPTTPVPATPLPTPAAPIAEAPAPASPTVALPEAAQPQAAVPAASSCDRDFQKLANARQAQIGALNRLAKGKGNKMDPIAACGKLQGLAGIEARMVAYVEKNKDWCGIPDAVTDNIKKGRQGTLSFAAKACNAAAQYRKALAQHNAQQQRAAANGAAAQNAPQVQKLPAGPL